MGLYSSWASIGLISVFDWACISKALSATVFGPHARTLALKIFPRTHFARTCAFCLVAPRTRTRTSNYLYRQYVSLFTPLNKRNSMMYVISSNVNASPTSAKKKPQSYTRLADVSTRCYFLLVQVIFLEYSLHI